ncbi:FAD-dependent oxidoreductase [Gloeothece verrucosa]|uniref:Response regulator receiver modulated FAD-dependent pyridine nucleotide-disulfide oxidoreductase n=1 Tax=Gloeothece verrucosa (strain PCC 7822) TaxID=497965 RepID=E0ULM0_GLOV7|nr:FAD-dependent oxidoreductase [Gloeothece verrucosa]ADN17850.1 response regulator receiver modulated FAD-dependent pyridine nucleotide-disulfide oxidoreductase [Gloeothece verrucosa PCC 7822]
MAKPVIITLDDDPQVLRTIVQDLRNKYGAKFRVISSDSSEKILETLEALKKRQESVALFLVDQRMPKMTGVEFLEQAKDLFPDAKRALLTAYADTNAAIDAINKAQVHYYLLKPWLPPEINLYPVLNDLLEIWQANSIQVFEGLQVIGFRWSPKSHQTKDFLARHHIPYIWRDMEKDSTAIELLSDLNLEASKFPIVVFPNGQKMECPSNQKIAEIIGLKTRAEMPFYDLVVIGGGPAGLAASVYASSEGLKTVLLEKEAPGGQAGTSSRIENYLGFPMGLTGSDLARRAVAQAQKFGTEIISPQEVASICLEGQYRVVTLADGTKLSCHALIIASGVSYVKLNIPGIDHLNGAGVYYGAAITEAISCRNDDVYIVGGANSAGQAAMCLCEYARSVTLVIRGESLGTKMSKYLVDRIEASPNIYVKVFTEVVEVLGEDKLTGLKLANSKTGKVETVAANALFIFIGAKPNTDWLQDFVERDDNGFILTGPSLMKEKKALAEWPLLRPPFLFETNIPGTFAIGDVRSGSVKRVASAVGEGAMAVQFVHQYLSSF